MFCDLEYTRVQVDPSVLPATKKLLGCRLRFTTGEEFGVKVRVPNLIAVGN